MLFYRLINFQDLGLTLLRRSKHWLSDQPDWRHSSTSPVRLLVITISTIFLTEALIMALLHFGPPLSIWEEMLLDASFLSVVVFLPLYLLLFRPLLLNIAERQRAEEALRQINTELELRVQQRTENLVQLNVEREHLLQQVTQDREAIESLAGTLAEERDILQTIMENTHTLLAYLDPQFNFIQVNSAYVQSSGHIEEELLGHNHFELFPNQENQAIFERVVTTGQPVTYLAKPFEYADQPERGITYWDWTLVPVKDSLGQVQGLVFSLLDVTERKRAEKMLQLALAEAQQRQAEIAALLAGSRSVLHHREFEPAARFLFDTCKQLLGATAGFIALLSDDGKWNEVVLLDAGESAGQVETMLRIPFRGLAMEVGLSGRVIYENDFASSHWAAALPPGHLILDNLLLAPLELDTIVVGLLCLGNKPGGFTENDTRIALAFGELAAISLLNSRTLESLQNSEERFRSVTQTANEAIITIDSQGKIVFWNNGATTILRYSAEEAIGRPLTFVIPERFRSDHRRGLERLVATGQPALIGKTMEMVGLRKDGTEFPTELSLSSWKSKGEVFFTGILHDITERKQAEEALRRAYEELDQRVQERTAELARANEELQLKILERERMEREIRLSEERFRQLAENISEIFWIITSDHRQTLYVSPGYERMWEASCASLYERPDSFLESIHPEDRARVSANQERQAQTECDEQYRLVRSDGSIRWIRTRSFPVRNEQGIVYRIAGISEDVTERVLAYQTLEQRVEERTRELATLLEVSQNLATTLDMDRLLDLILHQLKLVVDYDGAIIYTIKEDSLIPLAHQGLISLDEVFRLRFSFEQALLFQQIATQRTPVIIPDIRGDTPEARIFRETVGERLHTIFASASSWLGVPFSIQERVIGMLALTHQEPDYYTERHAELARAFAGHAALAIENARLYEQGQELATMKERQRLARDLHDSVSQGLFSATLSAEVLPRLWERNPEEGRRCLLELQQFTRGALAEMRTLLLELRPAGLVENSLSDLLAQLAEAITSRARLRVIMEVEPSKPLPPKVQVGLYRIAQEALNNVVKHARASQVVVSFHCNYYRPATRIGQRRKVELRISDDGRGFDPKNVSPFSLGLNIMRERAETIGASVRIKSQPGQGTEVVAAWSED